MNLTIGKVFVAAGTILNFFGGEYAEAGTFLVTLGTDIITGTGTFGPIRMGSEAISGTVGPWQAPTT